MIPLEQLPPLHKIILAAIIAFIARLITHASEALMVGALVMTFLDTGCGMARAIWSHDWNKRAAFQGVIKFLIYTTLIFVSLLLEDGLSNAQGVAIVVSWWADWVLSYIMLVEAISVLGHLKFAADKVGLNLPGLDAAIKFLYAERKHMDEKIGQDNEER